LGLRELLFNLIVSYTLPFCVSPAMVHSLLKEGEASLPVIFLIRDVLKAQPDLSALFETQECLSVLFRAAVDNYSAKPLLSCQSFRIIQMILSHCTNPELEEYASRFQFTFTSEINCATAEALLTFPSHLPEFVPKFFGSELPTILNSAVVKLIGRMSVQELGVLAESTHICKLAMDCFADYRDRKINGHFLDVVMVFSDKGICCCSEHESKWEKFVCKRLPEQYRRVMSNYGGETNADDTALQKDLFASMDDLYSLLGSDDE
jgi:hypothetical protein